MKRPFSSVLQVALFGAVLVSLGAYVFKQWELVRDVSLASPGGLAIATCGGLAGSLMIAIGASVALCRIGHPVSLLSAIGVVFVPNLGKYLPGKVWSVLGAVWCYTRIGVSRSQALLLVTLLMVIGFASTTVVATASAAVVGSRHQRILGMTLALATLAVVASPPLLRVLSRFASSVTGREVVSMDLDAVSLAMIMLPILSGVALYGVGFALLVQAISSAATGHVMECIALYSTAQIVGFIAVFAPAGLGVREGVLIAGLTPLVGPGPAIAAAGLARLWQTSIELSMALLGWFFLRRAMVSEEPARAVSQCPGLSEKAQ